MNWDQYLAPAVVRMLPVSGHMFMLAVGAVEVIAGLLIAVVPRIGAWIVAVWLCGIIVNLLLIPGYFDVARGVAAREPRHHLFRWQRAVRSLIV